MKKITFNGKTLSVGQWARELNIPYLTLYKRIYELEWDIEKALTKNIPATKKKKVMILNDIHVPFQNNKILEEIEKQKADYIVIGGDLIDCQSCSSFPMLERPSLEKELIQTHLFIQKIREITASPIYCIVGNHEERLEKEISKMQQKGLSRMLDPQLIRMIQDGFNFYIDNKKITYEPIKDFNYIHKWYAKLFDNMVICHPKSFSNIPARVSEQCAEYFLNRNIIDKDDIVFLGHTHKYSSIVATRRQNIYVVENGCCCNPQDYADCGKLGYSDQVNCYTIAEFYEGKKIDKNDIKTFFF